MKTLRLQGSNCFYCICLLACTLTSWSQTFSALGPDDATYTVNRGGRPALAVHANGTIYGAFLDLDLNNTVAVKKMTPNGWQTVGQDAIAVSNTTNLILRISSAGELYLASLDFYSPKIRKFNGSTWEVIPTSTQINNVAYGFNFILDNYDVPHISFYRNGTSAFVYKLINNDWVMLGGPSIQGSKNCDDGVLMVNSNNELYLGFTANETISSSTDTFYVKKLVNNSWISISKVRAQVVKAMQEISMCIDDQDSLYLAYSDDNYSRKLSVRKFSGGSWKLVGSSLTNGISYYNQLVAAKNSADVFLLAYDGGNNQFVVKKYSGNTWYTVGDASYGSIGSTYNLSQVYMALSNTDVPYISCSDRHKNNIPQVLQMNASQVWEPIDKRSGISTAMANYTQFALNKSDVPYLAYLDASLENKARVKKYTNNQWTDVGSAGFSQVASQLCFKLDTNGVPYVAVLENADKTIRVFKYATNSWQAVGLSLTTTNTFSDLNLDIHPLTNLPYLVYYEVGTNSRTLRLKYNDGLSTAWNNVLSTNVLSSGQSMKIAFDKGGVLHMAYTFIENTYFYKLYIGKIKDGVFSNQGRISNGTAKDIVVMGGQSENTAYFLFNDLEYSSLRMVYWNGTNTSSKGFFTGSFESPSMTINKQGKLFVAAANKNLNKKLAVYTLQEPSTWTLWGPTSISEGVASAQGMAISSTNELFVAYTSCWAFVKKTDVSSLITNTEEMQKGSSQQPSLNVQDGWLQIHHTGQYQVTVLDVMGKIHHQHLTEGSWEMPLDQWSAGMYLIRVEADKQVYSKKIWVR
ncbi:MAG: T9SS type A sorting domain-containing protein [Cytophagaceae bacterium]|jgi:hypothetical protein|nr:T9SS type A sorting domain-containing protein [Cytophagaceae bacterium]